MRSREVAKEVMIKPDTTAATAVQIMDADSIRRALREIARRIADTISVIEKTNVDVGTIDVAMHRDDVGTRAELPIVQASRLPLPLENRTVVIVDDVLFTGRTVRAAMDAINSFGRPARIQLAALIDRGHRELPIRADYVGKNLPTAFTEKVRVQLGDDQGSEGVWLIKEEKR